MKIALLFIPSKPALASAAKYLPNRYKWFPEYFAWNTFVLKYAISIDKTAQSKNVHGRAASDSLSLV